MISDNTEKDNNGQKIIYTVDEISVSNLPAGLDKDNYNEFQTNN